MRSEFKTKSIEVVSELGSATLLYDTIVDYTDAVGGIAETERARSNPRLANDSRSIKHIGNRQYEARAKDGSVEVFTESDQLMG